MTKKYRRRGYTVSAIRWLGEENCEEVFAFLGLEHPDDELDHEAIHFENPDGTLDTVFPGEWVVADGQRAGHRAYQDRRFQVTFESAEEAADEHVYLSTGCLHGQHEYCKSMTGTQGAKRGGACKFCDAKCTCSCHAEEES